MARLKFSLELHKDSDLESTVNLEIYYSAVVVY